MKKFISFVMAGAMIASLVPATAFAKGDVTATAKVVDALEKDKSFTGGVISGSDSPELQLKVTAVDYLQSNTSSEDPELKVTVTLDKAEFTGITATEFASKIKVTGDSDLGTWNPTGGGTDATTTFTASGNKAAAAIDVVDNANATKYVLWKSATDKVNVADLSYDKVGTVTESAAAKRTAAFAAYVTANAGDPAAYSVDDYTWNASNNRYDLKVADPAKPDFINEAALTGAPFTDTVVDATAAKASLEAAIQTELNDSYALGTVTTTSGTSGTGSFTGDVAVKKAEKLDVDQMEITFVGKFQKDDVISFLLASTMTKTSEGTKATVSVDSKAVTADDLVYASILSKGFKVSVRKTVDVAEDEVVTLNSNGLKIESNVGNVPSKVTLKISNGFEFPKACGDLSGTGYTVDWVDEKELTVNVTASVDEITVKDIKIEAASAKSGAVATITAKSSNNDSASCEVAKVVDYKVSFTVDADEDVPVIYSGVNVKNDGITDDSDHLSLEVTAKESFPGAWSMRQGFNFNLPDGVYVTNVKVTDADNFYQGGKKLGTDVTKTSKEAWQTAFFDAYQDGDHKNFEFDKRVFDDVNTNVTDNDPAELTFQLELVADPTFEGDVTLSFEGALVDKQEVKIAKFVKPYTVKAEQNDVIIDYRNTEVKTPVVITEAEEGLLKKGTIITLNVEDDLLTFEDDPTFTVDADSDMELKDEGVSSSKDKKGTIEFTVKEESDKAASVTISDMKLYMSRSIPAGAYDLEVSTTMDDSYDREILFAPDADATYVDKDSTSVATWTTSKERKEMSAKEDSYVDDVCDYSEVVKEAFINVVTGGVDKDNMFTTKVVVPVGESYLVAGSTQVTLDAPAYVSAAGYTMLPVRAVSKALGVDTNNVLWNAETRTVTIMYSQRIITMTVGTKTIYVNGSAIPSSAAPEIKDGRTFLPLRDLGTALGVTDVAWDASTKTATLNGGTTTATTTTK